MPAYDILRFSPPAPLATVALRDSTSGAIWTNLSMLLDTGADVTLLPTECLSRLGVSADRSQMYELMGFDGSRSTVAAIQLDLIFLEQTFRGRFLLIDQAEGILGRDVLNHLSLLFDGPRLVWQKAPAS